MNSLKPVAQRRACYREQVRSLVEELGSYSAAEELGITRQAVHALIGPGAADGRRVEATCVDCGKIHHTHGHLPEPRYPRCKAHRHGTGQPWHPGPVQRRARTHCKRGIASMTPTSTPLLMAGGNAGPVSSCAGSGIMPNAKMSGMLRQIIGDLSPAACCDAIVALRAREIDSIVNGRQHHQPLGRRGR